MPWNTTRGSGLLSAVAAFLPQLLNVHVFTQEIKLLQFSVHVSVSPYIKFKFNNSINGNDRNTEKGKHGPSV